MQFLHLPDQAKHPDRPAGHDPIKHVPSLRRKQENNFRWVDQAVTRFPCFYIPNPFFPVFTSFILFPSVSSHILSLSLLKNLHNQPQSYLSPLINSIFPLNFFSFPITFLHLSHTTFTNPRPSFLHPISIHSLTKIFIFSMSRPNKRRQSTRAESSNQILPNQTYPEVIF